MSYDLVDPLITAAELRAALPDVTISDATATRVIGQVSSVVRGYCRQGITQATYTSQRLALDYDKRGWFVPIPQRPLVSVASVEVNGTAVASPVVDLLRNRVSLPDGLPAIATDGLENQAVVTYTAGESSTPGDIKAVCLAVGARLVSNPSGAVESSEKLGEYAMTVRYATSDAIGPTDLTESELRTLRRYRGGAGSVRLS
jgi:hypothetical protein